MMSGMKRAAAILMGVLATLGLAVAPANAANVQYTLYSTEQRVTVSYSANDQWVHRGQVNIKDRVDDGWKAVWTVQGRSGVINASASNPEKGAWLLCEIKVNGRTISTDYEWGTVAQVVCR